MTQEEKQLLLKDICARIPYGLFCQAEDGKGKLISVECSTGEDLVYVDFGYPEAKEYDLNEGDSIKPYLRPMSSMTEEEKKEYESFFSTGEYSCGGSLYGTEYEYIADSPDDISQSICLFDWLDVHHFDYRGLIEKGLALEAPEDMYKLD